LKTRITLILVGMLSVMSVFASSTHAAALSPTDFNNAVSNTLSPIQDALTGFLTSGGGWYIILGLVLLVFFVVLAWRLGYHALRRLGRLGR
jgi:uncharacterized BrkB/YihY/UPF0761 family membrane protein